MAITFRPYHHVHKQYIPAYMGNDREVLDMGLKMKVVYNPKLYWRDDYGDSAERWVEVTFNRGVTRDELREACYEPFTSGCGCEHDCCGHINSSASAYDAHRLSRNGRRWAVRLSYYRNV